ncbi:unnamed protein product [Strongylus vulgaris]|uniref:ER membrane protein complex subunit 2 n=1 Tax=Strongylus vulgaris TaxID=40348 RepID=A0A3P7K0L7_STRVU|nr:unnamed protein product [Strongylus vulgaris]
MHHEAADQYVISLQKSLKDFLFDTALALYERLIENDPTNNPLNTLYLRRLADIRYTQGGQENIDLARAYYEQAAKLNPADLHALYGIVLVSFNAIFY